MNRSRNNSKSYLISFQLAFDGVEVSSIEVKINKGNAPANVLLTYKQKSDVDLAAGLDFGPNGNVFAHFIHPQHAPFMYTIQVNNSSGAPRKGTCRIFMCPREDDRGQGFKYNEARNHMIEMDKFTVDRKLQFTICSFQKSVHR